MESKTTINPGGRLALAEIVGREREISRYWRILDRQGLILSSERRLGKTHIVQKMHQNGRRGFVTFYQDLEGVHTVMELIRSLYNSTGTGLSRRMRIAAGFVGAWEAIVPKKIGNTELPRAGHNWKPLLTAAIRDILNNSDQGSKLVLIWDEFPLMIYNLVQKEGAGLAIELLNELRKLRQDNGEALRFLFTGSISLHIILRSLRHEGAVNDSTNDMYSEIVPPMEKSESIDLATRLLCQLSPPPKNIPHLANQIYEQIGGFPYYIHHVADQLDQLDRGIVPNDIPTAVQTLIHSDQDPAHFRYYVDRLNSYYQQHESELSRLILNKLSFNDSAMDMPTLLNHIRHESPEVGDKEFKHVLGLLQEDHYLQIHGQKSNPEYDFRWRVVKQWWKENSG